jgi:hypothetical protein
MYPDRKTRRAEERKKNATKFGAKKSSSSSAAAGGKDDVDDEGRSQERGGLSHEVRDEVLRDILSGDGGGASEKKARVLEGGDLGDIMYSGLVDSSTKTPKAGAGK